MKGNAGDDEMMSCIITSGGAFIEDSLKCSLHVQGQRCTGERGNGKCM